jgi:hypothetical protein
LGRKGFLAYFEVGKPTPVAGVAALLLSAAFTVAAFGLDSTVLWDRLITFVAALPLVVGAVALFRYQRDKKDNERREQLPAALAAEACTLAAGSRAREEAHVYHGSPLLWSYSYCPLDDTNVLQKCDILSLWKPLPKVGAGDGPTRSPKRS